MRLGCDSQIVVQVFVLSEVTKRLPSRQICDDIHCKEVGLLGKVHYLYFGSRREIFRTDKVNEFCNVLIDSGLRIDVLPSRIL